MISGYIHVATIGEWKGILADQINLIAQSGLRDLCDRVHLCKVGEGHAPLDWTSEDPELENFEFPTLQLLHANAIAHDGISFYVHLKGVSKTPDHWEEHKVAYLDFAGLTSLEGLKRHEHLWRKYMEHFIIGRHPDCIDALRDHDLAGVEWRDKPKPHFSGNFWWARNDYLRTLETPAAFRTRHSANLDVLGSNRWNAEFWVGHASPRVAVIHNLGLNLFHVGAAPQLYRSTKLL